MSGVMRMAPVPPVANLLQGNLLGWVALRCVGFTRVAMRFASLGVGMRAWLYERWQGCMQELAVFDLRRGCQTPTAWPAARACTAHRGRSVQHAMHATRTWAQEARSAAKPSSTHQTSQIQCHHECHLLANLPTPGAFIITQTKPVKFSVIGRLVDANLFGLLIVKAYSCIRGFLILQVLWSAAAYCGAEALHPQSERTKTCLSIPIGDKNKQQMSEGLVDRS